MKSDTKKTTVLNKKSLQEVATISFGVVLLYIVLFFPLYKLISRPAIAFAIVPIFVIANISGWKGGLTAGFASIPLNILLFSWAGESDFASFLGKNFWFSHLVFIVFGVSVGYLHNMREQLQKDLFEREQLIADLDAFAHTVAHDLKNPLSNIIGFSEVLEREPSTLSNPIAMESVKCIKQSTIKMDHLLDELLLLARVRWQDMKTLPCKLEMGVIIEEVEERLAPTITEHQAKIIRPSDWPTAIGYGPWVEEVWMNYISNAIKYGGRPPVVEIGATPEDNGIVRFWVRDNGDGLSTEEQAQLFTVFTRLGEKHVKGHGLGLSIAKRITEKLGGEVGIESEGESGQGCTLSFTLPV